MGYGSNRILYYPAVFMRFFCTLAALVLLSGCSGSLVRLSLEAPDANDYNSSLAAEYLAYAQSELEQGHLITAEYFADKGMAALEGKSVPPELPAIKDAESLQNELMKAREGLLSLQTDDIKRVAPQKVARAQLLFDCWSHQKSLAAAELAPCQDEFRSTLTEVQMIADSFIYGQETVHVLRFAAKKASPGEASRKVISEISERAACIVNYVIEIHLPHDRKTLALSKKRANAVRELFIARKILPERVKIQSQNDGKAVHLSSDEDAVGPDELRIVMRSFGMVGI